MSFRISDEHYEFEDGGDYAGEAFVAGERLCAPARTQQGSTMLSAFVVIVFMMAGAWIAVSYPQAWQAVVTFASKAVDLHPASPNAPDAAQPLPQAAVQTPLPEMPEIMAAPGADAGSAVPSASEAPVTPDTTAETKALDAEEPSTEIKDNTLPSGDEKPSRLSPPTANPSDPNQKRALAAGLHPDLSRALLAQLTATDYGNARKAIKTALAQTPDDDVYTWPREAAAQRAQFEVKFVTSASADCRRYVVIVSKNRWSTTAPPMETCGSDLPKRTAARKQG